MSKPRVDPTFGISSVDVVILTERHPACRWREAQPGSCKERENLAGDAKGKGPSGANRKAESTDDGHARLGFCRLRASARNVQQHWNNPVRVNISRPCAKTNAAGARIDIRSTFGHYRGRNRIFAYRALADGIFAQGIFTDRRSHRLRLRPWEVGSNCCSHEG
jgi:hypothetical protein